VLDQTKEVQIPSQSSSIYLSFNTADLSAKADPHRSFLAFDLEVAGKRISRNLLFFDVMHNLDLPVTPKIDAALSRAGEGYSITLQSGQLARSISLSFGDLDVQSSDNYFDLLPGEPVTINLKSSATLDHLRNALKIMSLTEAFTTN